MPATQVIVAHTRAGDLVADLDDDPALRAATAEAGRTYQAITTAGRRHRHDAAAGAHLVTARWPRRAPRHRRGPDRDLADVAVLTDVAARLAPGGYLAVLLDPTRGQSLLTWHAGPLITAAARLGLGYLQDIVILDTPLADEALDPQPRHPARRSRGRSAAGSRPGPGYRVVLVLRGTGRHAQP